MVKYFSGAVSTTGCVARVTAVRVCLGPLITVYQKLPETYLLRAPLSVCLTRLTHIYVGYATVHGLRFRANIIV